MPKDVFLVYRLGCTSKASFARVYVILRVDTADGGMIFDFEVSFSASHTFLYAPLYVGLTTLSINEFDGDLA